MIKNVSLVLHIGILSHV